MKNKTFLSSLLMLFPLFFNTTISAQCNDLIITAVFDGPLDGGPRGIELYAKRNISDLSIFSIGSATNGEGSDGEEFTLPKQPIDAGTFLYIANDAAKFYDFFGFTLDLNFIPTTNAAVGFLNGDDAIELFCNSEVVDIFGVINHTKTGLDWNYTDGWAYRLSGTGSDGATFNRNNWSIDRNGLDEATSNRNATSPIPLGTYDTFPACDRMILTGIFDGPLTGGTPKGIELFVYRDISDLSLFGFGSATNGGGSDGIEFNFPQKTIPANTYLYLTNDSTAFHDFFGFAPNFEDNSAGVNGDDAVELFCKQGASKVIDVFGDIDVDGTGSDWEYTDGWVYRKDLTATDRSDFIITNWHYSGRNALEGGNTNSTVKTSFPIGTYKNATSSTNCPENNQLPVGNIADGTYYAANTLIATSTIPINGDVILNAGEIIVLKSGFYAETGSQFIAKIAPCAITERQAVIRPQVSAQITSNNNKEESKIGLSNFDWIAYPNPTSTDLTVDVELAAVTTIELKLVDISGRLLRTLHSKQKLLQGNHKFRADLSEFQAGIYWLQLSGEKEQAVQKIVIVK